VPRSPRETGDVTSVAGVVWFSAQAFHCQVYGLHPDSQRSTSASVASGIRCKSAGVVPGFMIRLGDGADSCGLVAGLGCWEGARPQLAWWFEQGAARLGGPGSPVLPACEPHGTL
jgi:hypothetical protein